MTNYNHIDIAVIEETSAGDKDLTLSIITMFLQGAPELLTEIRKNLDDGEHSEIASVAHKLKPMFAYVGALDIKEELENIELQAKQKESLEILSSAIQKVEDKMDGIIKELNSLQSSLGSD